MKKMKLSFWIVALFMFSGIVADAADWTGIWINATSGNEISISQNGQQINAILTKPSATTSEIYGFKSGDQAFYGTLNGQTMIGKYHLHFPVSYQTTCPAQWDRYADLVLTMSSDGNTIDGQYVAGKLQSDCSVVMDTAPTTLKYIRKDYGNVNGDDKIDLTDAILALKVLAGISVSQTVNLNADVNGDKKIGNEEVVYILQKVAGLR